MKEYTVAITGEGPTDFGQKMYGRSGWNWGPVKTIIDKCADKMGVHIVLIPIERQEVERFKLQRSHKRAIQGKSIASMRFAIYALDKKECKLGIYYCDADKEAGKSNSDRRVCGKHFRALYDEVWAGMNMNNNGIFRGIPMIAVKMIESWLLADESAFDKAFGKVPAYALPSEPELIWGDKRDPDSNYPKCYLKRVVCSMGGKFAQESLRAGLYNEIAEHIDVDRLTERCPIGFGKFYDDIEMLCR